MYWKKRYAEAQKTGRQLISDKTMRKTFINENPDRLILQEVVFPKLRADIIEFVPNSENNIIVGYEFKSDRDNLYKLKKQLREYLKWCNVVYVYATFEHKKELRKIINSDETLKERVGVRFYRIYEGFKYFVDYKKATIQDLRNTGLSIDWITKRNKLFRWLYFLEDVYGIGV